MQDEPAYTTRDEMTGGYRAAIRVFVTLTQFTGDCSRTRERAEAALFSRREAERLVAHGTWPRVPE